MTTTWADAWDHLIAALKPEPPTAPEAASAVLEPVDHTKRGCCETHILYGKPGVEPPTGLLNASAAAPSRTSSRKGRRNP